MIFFRDFLLYNIIGDSNMAKERVLFLLECILVFLFVFIYNRYCYSYFDHFIDFTHAYSLSNGLSLYKDFNIIIGPVYPFLISIFLSLFGKNLFIFDTIHAFIVVSIFILLKHHNPKTLAMPLICIFSMAFIAKYNIFILLLFYILYYLEQKEFSYKDYVIGIILSIIIFTKINMGIYLIFPTIFLHYRHFKIIWKRFLGCFVTSCLFLLILFCTNTLFNFFHYTVFGLVDFPNNSFFDVSIFFFVFAIIYLLFCIKKDKTLIYMLCFSLLAYPIFDLCHVFIAIFPIVLYFLDSLPFQKGNSFIIIFFCCFYYLISLMNIYSFEPSSMDCQKYYCASDLSNKRSFRLVKMIDQKLDKKEYDRIYYLNNFAYFTKLYLHEKITKFDFIWIGNIGYHGEENYIKEIHQYCDKHTCLFVILPNDIRHSQISEKIIHQVTKDYKNIDQFTIHIDLYSVPVELYSNLSQKK